MKFDLMIFDLDGTLLDTNNLIINSFRHTFNKFFPNMGVTDKQILSFIGPTLQETFDHYATSDVSTADLISCYRQYSANFHNDQISIYPRVKEIIETLAIKGVKLAIASNKHSSMVRKGLALFNIEQYFPIICGNNDVTSPKPAPDMIMKIFEYFNFSKYEGALMIGDNGLDIEAGRNANIKTAAVGWAFKGRDYLLSFNPDYIINQMDDLLRLI